jgi:D-glycero-D-manno-heptose 1,7-bisphosphate phosphatase
MLRIGRRRGLWSGFVGDRAVFLDRDGVINVDRGYVHRIEDFEFLPGAPEALARLQRAGWRLVVVTNQSGIGRGLFSEADYQRVTQHMREQLALRGVTLDSVFHCPHAPDYGCGCRKPKPGLLHYAAAHLGLDLSHSVMVGDKECDLLAAEAAGLYASFLVSPEAGIAGMSLSPPQDLPC